MQTVLFVSTTQRIACGRQTATIYRNVCVCDAVALHPRIWGKWNYDCGRFCERGPTRVHACAAYAFAKVKTERPQANGFIFMHSDFRQPNFFSGVSKLDVDQLWHTGWATPKLPGSTWTHWSQNLHKVRTALQTFSAIGLRVPHTACGDWSDLYFILHAISVMTRMSDLGIQNEIAICTGRQVIEPDHEPQPLLPGCPKSYPSSAGIFVLQAVR